jgi:zinc protease
VQPSRDRATSGLKPLRRLRALAAAGVIAAGCTPPPEPPQPAPQPKPIATAPAPVATAPAVPERETPPKEGAARDFSLPPAAWGKLANGLEFATIVSPALPIVQIRVVVSTGSSSDGDKPGLARVTGDLLKDGGAGGLPSREVIARVESLGATLDISTSLDRTTLSIAVTKDQFAEALELVAAVAEKPAMSPTEFGKLKKRAIDDAADHARTDSAWAASMMLYKGLFASSTGKHPYATFDATADDLGKLTVNDCRAFHKKFFVPKNMFVVVAGDVAQDEVKTGVEKAFGSASGGDAPAPAFTAPAPVDHLEITLVDRPKSTQSDIYAGVLAPERASPAWPAFSTANQILGGGVSGRLFLDVREKQSLAYRAQSSLHELAHGPSLMIAYVGAQSPKTGLAVKALLDHLDRLGSSEPSAEEVAIATRFLSDVSALRLETVGALANELCKNRTLGLPDDYPVLYRKQVRAVTVADATSAAAEHVRATRATLVVAGDAKMIGPMLSHFGEVKVVDPMKGFATKETLAKNPEAALELPEEAGK